MIKKLIVTSVVGFVILTVIVAVRSARTGNQKPSPRPVMQMNNTLNLDTSPSRFPQR